MVTEWMDRWVQTHLSQNKLGYILSYEQSMRNDYLMDDVKYIAVVICIYIYIFIYLFIYTSISLLMMNIMIQDDPFYFFFPALELPGKFLYPSDPYVAAKALGFCGELPMAGYIVV